MSDRTLWSLVCPRGFFVCVASLYSFDEMAPLP